MHGIYFTIVLVENIFKIVLHWNKCVIAFFRKFKLVIVFKESCLEYVSMNECENIDKQMFSFNWRSFNNAFQITCISFLKPSRSFYKKTKKKLGVKWCSCHFEVLLCTMLMIQMDKLDSTNEKTFSHNIQLIKIFITFRLICKWKISASP